MSRGHQRAVSILESMETADELKMDVSLPEQELRNWAAWIRSIRSPIPCESAKGILLFREVRPQYPDESVERIEPEVPRAEACEAIISRYQQLPLVCFYCTFVLQMTNEKAAAMLNEWNKKQRQREGHGEGKNRFNALNYASALKGGMMILDHDLRQLVED